MDTTIPFKRTLLLSLPLVVTLGGCGKKEQKMVIAPEEKTGIFKQSDIPLPLGYRVVDADQEQGTEYYSCTGSMSFEQLVSFYQRAMETQGWKISTLNTKKEGLLLCSKPSRVCTISIRPTTQQGNDQTIASLHLLLQARTRTNHQTNSTEQTINDKSII